MHPGDSWIVRDNWHICKREHISPRCGLFYHLVLAESWLYEGHYVHMCQLSWMQIKSPSLPDGSRNLSIEVTWGLNF